MTEQAFRRYDLTFNRVYEGRRPGPDERPPRPEPVGLVPVRWHGLNLSPGWVDDRFTAIVENVTGWYDTPTLNGRDTERALADGGNWGFKTIEQREITVTGAAAGPRAQLMNWRDQLAGLAAEREPLEFAITDPWLGVTHTSMVRAGTDRFKFVFIADGEAFRWEVTLTAADPLLYDQEWRQAILTTTTAPEAGRVYPRQYPDWVYGDPHPPGSAAYIRNDGNAPAPVYAEYVGDLSESRLDEGGPRAIILAALGAGVTILVPTGTLAAQAPGGAARQAFVLPGSRPLVIPPFSTARWHLYAQGSGEVVLNWRSAWW